MTWTKEDAQAAGRKGGLAKAAARAAEVVVDPAATNGKGGAEAVSQQTAAVKARWASERGTEEEVTRYFAHSVSIEAGLQLLARMRKNCELASYALNTRITADSDTNRCEFCHGRKKNRRQWALVRPFRDPTTQLIQNHYFCSIECVALMNQRNQGVYGVSDRGMTPAMNPKNHPKEVPESQPEAEQAAIEAHAKSE